jgi:hypothetical protein
VPAHPAEHSVARRLGETMEGASAELVAWVGTQEDFEVFKAPNGKTKVKCTLTDHELLPVLETCKVYLGGKAYKKAKRKRELAAFDFAQFEPHIIAHKTDPHLLFCVRTQVTLMRDVTAVQNYVKSRAYQVAVEHWKKGQAKGKVEIEKLEVGGAGRKKRKGADEEDDDDESGDESEDEDMTAEEFAEMERLTVRMHSILPVHPCCCSAVSPDQFAAVPTSSLMLLCVCKPQGREDAAEDSDADDDENEGELVDRPQTNDSFVLADLERQVLGYESEGDDDADAPPELDLFGRPVAKLDGAKPKGRKPKEEKAARKEAARLKRLKRMEERKKQKQESSAADAAATTSESTSRKSKGSSSSGSGQNRKKKKRRIGIVSEEVDE